MKQIHKLALFVPVILALLLTSPLYAKSKAKPQEPVTTTATKIIDGDTIKINYDGQAES